MLAVAVLVAALVILFAPKPPEGDPALTIPVAPAEPTACTTDDRLCAAVEALENARQDPHLTPQEREVVEELGDEIDAILNPPRTTPPRPPPPTTRPPSTTAAPTTTTTTTTSLPPLRDIDQAVDQMIDDILGTTPPTTIPEDPDGAG